MFDEPQRGRLAVVWSSRVGIFGGQAVIHADDRQPSGPGQLFEHDVALIGCAERPAAAVDVQVHAVDGRGTMVRVSAVRQDQGMWSAR